LITLKRLLPLLLLVAAPAIAQSAADRQLRAIYEKEWAWRQEQFARAPGDEGYGASSDHLPRVDAASQQARLAYWKAILAELDKVPLARLSHEESLNAAVFRTSIEAFVANGTYRDWEMPFNADSNFWSSLAPRQGYRTAEQYRRYLGRMRDIPRYFDEQIVNMRAGLKRGFSVPQATLKGRDGSIAAYADADVEKNGFYAAFKDMPAAIPMAEQEAMRAQARSLIGSAVVPAYAKLLAFFRTDYLPNTRKTIAAKDLPDGAAFYRAQIREFTTLDLTPEQIHDIGLKEVARIEGDMRKTMADAKFAGTMAQFIEFLRTDPQFIARTPDELMGYSAYVSKRADGKIKDVIGLLPRYRFTIQPVPDAIAPYYTSGRGGLESCLMNTHDLPSRPLYNIPALTLHECNPGHSFQAALALEAPARPAFRATTYFSGYGEGWGLYTEWLGIEMGIYRTPYEEFGRETYEMWRAVRLVIDTGVHQFGWSRERAIDYLASHTALSRHEVETEVDRYISWPGQALAYKLGELTIRRKRAEAEAKLGDRFDQRWFHDTFLALGSVPLPVLERELDAWIAAGGPNPYATPPSRPAR